MIVLGIDPGPAESAWVLWDGEKILGRANEKNDALRDRLEISVFVPLPEIVAIEQVRGFGVMASDKLFDTCEWSGRFLEVWGPETTKMLPRKLVSNHLCGTGRVSNDRFVREALLARLGIQGTKKNPGPTYGISGHLWAALAVAVVAFDLYGKSATTHSEGRDI